MTAATSTYVKPGTAVPRWDARLKVTGAARYGADMTSANEAYAYLVTSKIAKGRIARIDKTAALATKGVIDVLTYREVGDAVRPGKLFSQGGYVASTVAPLASDKIAYAGQIVCRRLGRQFRGGSGGCPPPDRRLRR